MRMDEFNRVFERDDMNRLAGVDLGKNGGNGRPKAGHAFLETPVPDTGAGWLPCNLFRRIHPTENVDVSHGRSLRAPARAPEND